MCYLKTWAFIHPFEYLMHQALLKMPTTHRKMKSVRWQCQGGCGDDVTECQWREGGRGGRGSSQKYPKCSGPLLCSPLVIWKLEKGGSFIWSPWRSWLPLDPCPWRYGRLLPSLVQALGFARTLAITLILDLLQIQPKEKAMWTAE